MKVVILDLEGDLEPTKKEPGAGVGVQKCEICKGTIKPGLTTANCVCGKMFHVNCANREGECPHCGRPL